jgi:pectate lyase
VAACQGGATQPGTDPSSTGATQAQPSGAGQAASDGTPTTGAAGVTANKPDGSTGTGQPNAAPSGTAGQVTSAAGTPAAMGTAGVSAGRDAASVGQPAKTPDSPTSHPGVGASESKALGYGSTASGGGNAPARAAGSLAELQAAIDDYSGSGGLVLEYTGQFDFKSISDPCVQHTLQGQKLEIKNKSNVTILGRDGSAANFGIHIASASENVIVRNMTLGLLPGGGDSDMISLEGMNSGIPKNIWIDHNELFSSLADCPGAGDTAFDGMIDVKKGVDNVTISYNYLHDHHKASLHGYSDDDSQTRHVTFHHNVFENIGSRTPLQRHGYSHILNNLFSKVLVSGINVRMGGYALVEGNFFQDVKNPVTSRDSDAVGFWDLRDNNLASASDVAAGNSFGITWDDGNDGTTNALDWQTSQKFPEQLGYAYQAHPYACVRDGLKAVAGAGKKLATLTCDASSER